MLSTQALDTLSPTSGGKLLVLKVGSSSLVKSETNSIFFSNVSRLCELTCDLTRLGHRVVIVTSGAVGVGVQRLGLEKKPSDHVGKQACAAIGQVALMRTYQDIFSNLGLTCAQVLLTVDIMLNVPQHSSMIHRLLSLGSIPIINENDTIAQRERNFGDNDTLAAKVGAMIGADAVFLLTDVDALYTSNPSTDPDAKPIYEVSDMASLEVDTSVAGSKWGTGGMATKLKAAKIATQAGVRMVICNSNKMENVTRIVNGELGLGTVFYPAPLKSRPRRHLVGAMPIQLWVQEAPALPVSVAAEGAGTSGQVSVTGRRSRGHSRSHSRARMVPVGTVSTRHERSKSTSAMLVGLSLAPPHVHGHKHHEHDGHGAADVADSAAYPRVPIQGQGKLQPGSASGAVPIFGAGAAGTGSPVPYRYYSGALASSGLTPVKPIASLSPLKQQAALAVDELGDVPEAAAEGENSSETELDTPGDDRRRRRRGISLGTKEERRNTSTHVPAAGEAEPQGQEGQVHWTSFHDMGGDHVPPPSGADGALSLDETSVSFELLRENASLYPFARHDDVVICAEMAQDSVEGLRMHSRGKAGPAEAAPVEGWLPRTETNPPPLTQYRRAVAVGALGHGPAAGGVGGTRHGGLALPRLKSASAIHISGRGGLVRRVKGMLADFMASSSRRRNSTSPRGGTNI